MAPIILTMMIHKINMSAKETHIYITYRCLLTISVMNVMVDLGQNMLRPKCSKFDYLYGGCALFGDFSHLATYISIVRG